MAADDDVINLITSEEEVNSYNSFKVFIKFSEYYICLYPMCFCRITKKTNMTSLRIKSLLNLLNLLHLPHFPHLADPFVI